MTDFEIGAHRRNLARDQDCGLHPDRDRSPADPVLQEGPKVLDHGGWEELPPREDDEKPPWRQNG
jgi:hypothetical protein